MLQPSARVSSVHEVTPAWLHHLNLRGLLVDIDDTLLPAAANEVEERVFDWLAQLTEAGVKVAILSNGKPERVERVAKRAGIPALALAGKPLPRAFRRGLQLLNGVPAAQVGMLGDQLFTDVLGARWAGLTAILVTPLSAGKLPHTRMLRRLERWVLKER